jgi:hypothetical protein
MTIRSFAAGDDKSACLADRSRRHARSRLLPLIELRLEDVWVHFAMFRYETPHANPLNQNGRAPSKAGPTISRC